MHIFALLKNKNMGIILNKYDEKNKIDYTWYDSSNILYSECVDKENDFKELMVTFKNGSQYRYKNVDVNDYLMFRMGGLDGSQGKAFNVYIKPKYECEKIENKDINLINEQLEKEQRKNEEENKPKTYFISGHRNLTKEEFKNNYAPVINILEHTSEIKPHYVIGDYEGADIMAQHHLIDVLGVNPDRITVFCVGNTPMYVHPEIIHFAKGYLDDNDRDSAMTEISDQDIAFVRDNRVWSGTGENILRRHLMTKDF